MKKILLFVIVFLISQISFANALTFKIYNHTQDTFQLNTGPKKTFCKNSGYFISHPLTIGPEETASVPVSAVLGSGGLCWLTYNSSNIFKTSLTVSMSAPQNLKCSNVGYHCSYNGSILTVY